MRLMKWGVGAFAAGAVVFGVLALSGIVQAGGPLDRERVDEIIADKLGVTVDELVAAREAARLQIVDEAGAAGEITAEQAERLRNREPGEHGRHRGGQRGFSFRGVGNAIEIAAEAAGVTSDVLVQEMRDGDKSLADVAADHGVSRDELIATLLSVTRSELDTRVGNDDITQEQSDRIFEAVSDHIDRLVDGVRSGFRMKVEVN